MIFPAPLDRVRAAGLVAFSSPYSANLVVERGPGEPGEWDGLISLIWRPHPSGGWLGRTWPAATRPGPRYLREPINPAGTGMLAAGVQNRLSHRPGLHRGRKALVQCGEVAVLRDPNRNDTHEPIVPDRNEGGGFNIHDIRDAAELAGCIGLRPEHLSELLDVYGELARHQGPKVSLTVLERP